jgi:CDP-diacylglycerol--glycerol-3-phosphate 3-phosphatidyltransferase
MKKKLPHVLLFYRAIAGPISLFLVVMLHKQAIPMVSFLLLLGFLSDIFDGILARKYKVSTLKFRKADSWVDLFFWCCMALVLLMLRPSVFYPWSLCIVLFAAVELYIQLLGKIRFGKPVSVHSLFSKMWSVFLFVVIEILLYSEHDHGLLFYVFITGILAQAESIVILLLLKWPESDIRGIGQVLRHRKGLPLKRSILLNG